MQDTSSRLDEQGFPFVWNGQRDYGDGLANVARGRIAGLWPHDLVFMCKFLGEWRRAPRHIYRGPDFWFEPHAVSRDQIRPLNWVLLAHGEEPIRRAGKDIILPFQFWNWWPGRYIRDLEILINTLIVCGLFPVHRHDKPFGFGKGKMFFFSWQDDDFCDMDVNLVCDIHCSQFWFAPTWLGFISRKLYRKFRGVTYVNRYYRFESGNSTVIGNALAKAVLGF